MKLPSACDSASRLTFEFEVRIQSSAMDWLWVFFSLALAFTIHSLFAAQMLRRRTARLGAARHVADLPCPPGVPLFGNLFEVAKRGYHVCHLEWMQKYGMMFRSVRRYGGMWVSIEVALIVAHPPLLSGHFAPVGILVTRHRNDAAAAMWLCHAVETTIS